MSQAQEAILIFMLLVPLWVLLRKQYIWGVGYAVSLCVSASPFLRIDLPGALPELTLHRCILISLLFAWIRNKDARARLRNVPVRGWIALWLGVATISLLGTVDIAYSMKRYLDLVLERFLFYFIIVTSIVVATDAKAVQRGMWLGLLMVAFLAIIEKGTGFNPVDVYLTADEEFMGGALRDVTATYQHRILLGVAMAMAWPIAFSLLRDPETQGFLRFAVQCSVPVFLAAGYFSMSRGPWLGSVVGAGVIWLFGSRSLRKYIILMGIAAFVGLLCRPGVLSTLANFAKDTVDVDTHKGGSFMWRFELWRIAWESVTQNAWRFIFGYGPASGHTIDLNWSWSFRDRETTVTSWDNQYAYYMFQTGVLGFIAILAMFGTLVRSQLQVLRRAEQPNRDIICCLFASVIILLFMMTNVLIFARQLDYLFWTLVACALARGGYWGEKSTDPQVEPVDDFSWEYGAQKA